MTDKLPELREIQLIAADIDGNMTDPDNIIVIPPRLLRLIAQARKERGIKVIGITGRTHPGIEGPTVETSISGFTSFDAWVTESGGIYLDMTTGEKILRAQPIDREVIAQLTEEFLEIRGGAPLTSGDTTEEDPLWVGVTTMSSTKHNEERMTKALLAHGYTVIKGDDPLAIHDDDSPAARQQKKDALSARVVAEGRESERILQIEYNHLWVQFSPHGVNKTEAFEWLLERYGISRNFVIGSGDGENDQFIKVSGYPVVPKNAKQSRKLEAARVLDDDAGRGMIGLFQEILAEKPGFRASNMVDERFLDRFWSKLDVWDAQAQQQYGAMVDALLRVNTTAREQLITDAESDGIQGNAASAGMFPYRVVRGPGRENKVCAHFANLGRAAYWATDHGNDEEGRLEIQRNMGQNRWLAVVTYWRDHGTQQWHIRNRINERAGRQIDRGDLASPAA
jgi:HAD superfamily hydrolase (TIGR01484 family)